jgi:hypothetical protein
MVQVDIVEKRRVFFALLIGNDAVSGLYFREYF